MSKYIILFNPIDEKYKLMDNKPDASPFGFCLVDGDSVNDVLHDAKTWFDISPNEVEL